VPDGVPIVPEEFRPELRLLTRGAEKASDDEIAENQRAASVRLRAAERVREAAA
jgi:16S rRNA (cytosine1402-N4)-methyltransferase